MTVKALARRPAAKGAAPGSGPVFRAEVLAVAVWSCGPDCPRCNPRLLPSPEWFQASSGYA